MRRWSGQISQWLVDFRIISYEDNNDLSSLLARQLDPVMESLANSIISDRVITNNNSYVWVTNGDEIHGLNQRMLTHDTIGANFLEQNQISIVSVFTFLTFGPTGHGNQPLR